MGHALEMVAVPEEEELSFQSFLDLSPAERDALRTVRIQLPRLGQRGFGHFLVTFKVPRFQVKVPRFQVAQRRRIAR